MLRRINPILPGLVAGIVIYGLLIQLTGVWFVEDKIGYSIGLWYGIAIAAGILDGLGANESTKAMFITESLHDIKELIDKLGGDKKTILSFAGFGDILLTCTSEKSRNFTFGQTLAKSKEQAKEYLNSHTVEGVYTLKSIHQLIKDKNVDIGIINLIEKIVFHEEKPETLLKFLIEKQ